MRYCTHLRVLLWRPSGLKRAKAVNPSNRRECRRSSPSRFSFMIKARRIKSRLTSLQRESTKPRLWKSRLVPVGRPPRRKLACQSDLLRRLDIVQTGYPEALSGLFHGTQQRANPLGNYAPAKSLSAAFRQVLQSERRFSSGSFGKSVINWNVCTGNRPQSESRWDASRFT